MSDSYHGHYTGDEWYEAERKLITEPPEPASQLPPPIDHKRYLPVKLEPSGYIPVRAHPTDAGLDLKTPEMFHLPAHSFVKVDTGVRVAIPKGHFGLIFSKSGLMASGITSRGVIDPSYRGTIQVVLYNHGDEDRYFGAGDKISQMIIIPCITPEPYLVAELDSTERGEGGFGSTGK